MRISDWSSDVCSSDLNTVDHNLSVDASIAGVGVIAADAMASSFSCVEDDLFDGVRIHFPEVIDHGARRHGLHSFERALRLPSDTPMIGVRAEDRKSTRLNSSH